MKQGFQFPPASCFRLVLANVLVVVGIRNLHVANVALISIVAVLLLSVLHCSCQSIWMSVLNAIDAAPVRRNRTVF
jgi:hypothetical protein